MKKILALATIVLALGSILPSIAMADGPINLALFNPVQIVKEDQKVTAFQFSLIYGVNSGMSGVDLSLVSLNKGEGLGIQWAGVGIVEGGFTGWQGGGLASITRGEFTGLQTGVYTNVGGGSGVQLGWINTAEEFSGLQFGFVNITNTMTSGLQIGLINIIKNKEKLKLFPIVNWKF